MFWSKIWFFLTALVAGAAITVALILPRPAERQRLADERERVVTACDVLNILLESNARSRVDLAGTFARSEIDVAQVLAPASLESDVSADANKTARTLANQLVESTAGDKPEFVILIDGRGRAVGRVGIHEDRYGDTMAGYHLVDDALDGYMRDDLWLIDDKLYLVAGAPVIANRWAGAVVIGHEVDKELADRLVGQLGVDFVVYAGGQPVATTNPVEIHSEVQRAYAEEGGKETPVIQDCRQNTPFDVVTGSETYTALVARLPGEAGTQGAFFAVFVARPASLGLMGTLDAVNKEDIAFGSFPWILLGIGLIAALGLGIFLMIFEVDRPLRRLSKDSVLLAQGDAKRLDEERHRSHYGSIARSVNIFIDKSKREARSGTQPSVNPLPPVGPGGPSGGAGKPPPPSEFKFSDTSPGNPRKPSSGGPPRRAPTAPGERPALPGAPPARAPTNPPPGAPPPLRAMRTESGITAIDDIFAPGAAESGEIRLGDESHRGLYEEFLALKRQCGEPTANLTYEKFAGKLRASRDALIAKHNCRDVKFQVYIRDGAAALKAKPVGLP
ncbi:MXAN_5187 family protein [Haliangium ochraceum]|uniref:Double Cache domain-containing protein n=1 Tax=Haliangium ochraceum (strain DSM 14365 / JCM 11303 / SMP-2) TaxID=502025 RepID=D0LYY1_HALO1|nr:MXAN_5187 family protein [Haliangium ochraceum]ACY14451.1 hypothetical protein Hoch_1904 [Haliangium ochraceum DSM 14365]